MKRYKLIKEYPNSPKLSTIVDLDYSNDKYGVSVYRIEQEPKYLEYWQQVIDKEYEILSFNYLNNDKDLFTLRDNGCYRRNTNLDHSLQTLLRDPGAIIHSVKRLSS